MAERYFFTIYLKRFRNDEMNISSEREYWKSQKKNYGKQKEKKEKWHTFMTMENLQNTRSGR